MSDFGTGRTVLSPLVEDAEMPGMTKNSWTKGNAPRLSLHNG